jgi:hypothetical protein
VPFIDQFLLKSRTNAIEHLKFEIAETSRCQSSGEVDEGKVVSGDGRPHVLRAHEVFELGGICAIDGASER